MGSLLEPSDAVSGHSWTVLRSSEASSERSWTVLGSLGALLDRLGALLDPSWGYLWPSWALLGPSWAPLGPSWGGAWPLPTGCTPLAPPLDPSLEGVAPPERHHSYLVLSVNCAGTGMERAPQEPARDGSWHPALSGALVLRACYVTARSWEQRCSEMLTLPLALGSLGVESCLRHRRVYIYI